MVQPLLEKVDLDDVLGKFNVYSRYHAVTSAFIILGMIFNTIYFMNYVFVVEKVGYRCADNHLKDVEPKLTSNISNVQDSNMHSTEAWCRNPAACSRWIYDNPDSFMAEFNLACQEWKRTSVGSVHGFGYMIGLLFVGPLSDRFGRKPLIVITGVAAGVLGLAKSFATSYWVYLTLEFLEAGIGDPMSPLFQLAIEMVATKSRVTYTTICNAGLGGYALLPVMAWFVPYWRTLLRVIYTPGLLFIFLIFVLDESPRWLLSKGKKNEAVKILRNAAKQNKITIEENLDMISCETYKRLSFLTVMRDTLKSKLLLKRFAVCVTWWVACGFVAHGLLINSVSLGGNKYLNFGLMGLLKLPSTVLTGYIITKYNRRGPMTFFFGACAVFCIGSPYIPKNLIWLLILMYMLGKLASSMCVNAVYIFTSELFPTHTRNSMHALCSSVGRIGTILAPQTPLLMVYWSGLPSTLFGVMALVAGLATLFVPNTGEVNLPNTVRQAEALEKKNNDCPRI